MKGGQYLILATQHNLLVSRYIKGYVMESCYGKEGIVPCFGQTVLSADVSHRTYFPTGKGLSCLGDVCLSIDDGATHSCAAAPYAWG